MDFGVKRSRSRSQCSDAENGLWCLIAENSRSACFDSHNFIRTGIKYENIAAYFIISVQRVAEGI